MSSLLECLEWENKFSLNAQNPFEWCKWLQHVITLAKFPVYDILKICDVAAVFDMAQHAKYFNGDASLQSMIIPHYLTQHLTIVELTTYFQQQYFMQALYSHCAKYTVGMRKLACPSTEHMLCVPVIPYVIFYKLNCILQFPMHLYAWLNDVIALRSERAFTTTVTLQLSSNLSGRRKRKQLLCASSAVACETITDLLTEQMNYIHSLSPNYAPTFTCSTTLQGTKTAVITLHAAQQTQN